MRYGEKEKCVVGFCASDSAVSGLRIMLSNSRVDGGIVVTCCHTHPGLGEAVLYSLQGCAFTGIAQGGSGIGLLRGTGQPLCAKVDHRGGLVSITLSKGLGR